MAEQKPHPPSLILAAHQSLRHRLPFARRGLFASTVSSRDEQRGHRDCSFRAARIAARDALSSEGRRHPTLSVAFGPFGTASAQTRHARRNSFERDARISDESTLFVDAL
jgi:hypothetical protein